MMAELVKKLNIKKNSETTPCSIYTTAEEAGTAHISLKADNAAAYVPVVAETDERASGGRVKSNGETQAIAETGLVPYYKGEYKEPGIFTVNKPAGVSKLKLEVAGAGGGGGWWYKEAAYGGNGDKKNEVVAVNSAAQVLIITVGTGGNEYANTRPYIDKAGDGGASTVAEGDGLIILTAEGGGGAYQTSTEAGHVYNGAAAGNGEGGKGGTAGVSENNSYANPGDSGWVIIEWGEGIE